jgi:hypothetical protein
MKNFAIKLFKCGSLTQLRAKIVTSRNVEHAFAQAEKEFKPQRNQFVGAEAVRYSR